MELISFLGKLFGYTPEIANVISGELRSVSEARRRPKVLLFFIYANKKCRIYFFLHFYLICRQFKLGHRQLFCFFGCPVNILYYGTYDFIVLIEIPFFHVDFLVGDLFPMIPRFFVKILV